MPGGGQHSTAATLERVDSEAAVLPQDFEDTVHARQLKALCRRVGRRMSRQGPGRSPSMGLTHLNAARPREKSSGVPHCGSSKILSDLVSRRRATRLPRHCTSRIYFPLFSPPSSKRGHGDACASAGGVRTATLASRPLREGRASAVRVRRGRLGPVKRVDVLHAGVKRDPTNFSTRAMRDPT